jgi:hypothetical protein
MKRHLPPPRGLWALDKRFPPKWANLPENWIAVNLTGSPHPFTDQVTLDADPERDYDWSRLRCFYVHILVRPGIDATRTIKALLPVAEPYVGVIDVAQWRRWAVASMVPKLKAWPESMPERPAEWS